MFWLGCQKQEGVKQTGLCWGGKPKHPQPTIGCGNICLIKLPVTGSNKSGCGSGQANAGKPFSAWRRPRIKMSPPQSRGGFGAAVRTRRELCALGRFESLDAGCVSVVLFDLCPDVNTRVASTCVYVIMYYMHLHLSGGLP